MNDKFVSAQVLLAFVAVTILFCAPGTDSMGITAYSSTANSTVLIFVADGMFDNPNKTSISEGGAWSNFMREYCSCSNGTVQEYRVAFFDWLKSMYGITVPESAFTAGLDDVIYSEETDSNGQPIWMIMGSILSPKANYRVILAKDPQGRAWVPGPTGNGAPIHDGSLSLVAMSDFEVMGGMFSGHIHKGEVIVYGEYVIENLQPVSTSRKQPKNPRYTQLHFESPCPLMPMETMVASSSMTLNCDVTSTAFGKGKGLGQSGYYWEDMMEMMGEMGGMDPMMMDPTMEHDDMGGEMGGHDMMMMMHDPAKPAGQMVVNNVIKLRK